MATEAGEYIVGAYLQHFCGCTIINYNCRTPGGGVAGLPELDVLGLNLKDQIAYLCEVTTHLHGMREKVMVKFVKKHQQQKLYAQKMLPGYKMRYQLWSPRVSRTQIDKLAAVGFEVVVNGKFKAAVEQLRQYAKGNKNDTGNPFMRTMQILEHLKD